MDSQRKSNLSKIQVLQNRILKILFNKDWFTPTPDLHRELGLLQVKDIFFQSILNFVYKQKNGLLPEIFDDYFKTRNQIHNINTRQANKIDVFKSRTNIGYNRVHAVNWSKII